MPNDSAQSSPCSLLRASPSEGQEIDCTMPSRIHQIAAPNVARRRSHPRIIYMGQVASKGIILVRALALRISRRVAAQAFRPDGGNSNRASGYGRVDPRPEIPGYTPGVVFYFRIRSHGDCGQCCPAGSIPAPASFHCRVVFRKAKKTRTALRNESWV
jgi:hypothetical protein